jgi:hypothetical protein
MSLYTIYITVESMNLKRSYYEMMENPHFKNTIKNGFHIIATIL